jgi:putative oxidoreductase
MEALFVIGRIILGCFFLYSGYNHFKHLEMMSNYSKMKGVRLPSVSVALTGSLLVLGGLSFILGAYPVVGVILLAAFLLPVSFMMHNFWKITDVQQKMGERTNFLKNMALLGAVLMTLAIPRPWPLSVL